MSLITMRSIIGVRGFPRVSGDEPVDDMRALKEKMFSPRERG